MAVSVSGDIKVGIADWKVAKSPLSIITLGLGSCVGITMFDQVTRLGGLAHIMLPDSRQFHNHTNPAKYADLAIPMMLEELIRQGARLSNLVVKIAGGAQMFAAAGKDTSTLNIGARNIIATREMLKQLNLRLVGEDTGGNHGRTMILDTASGEVLIRTVGTPLKSL